MPGPARVSERYALTPLYEAARQLSGRPQWSPQQPSGFSLVDLANVLGIAVKSVHRYSHDGIPWMHADRYAVSLGLHPCLVWSDWWERCPALGLVA